MARLPSPTVEYQALYRKYRPQRFSEIIGQSHITETLTREVAEGKVAHAYLFAGPRGTGKTSTARALAKILNCTQPQRNGEPCGACVSCTSIAQGSSLDVIELDAASHNKVEDIRELRVGVSTVASIGGARRVFILDEAHMLSKAAGNALLKTLEEPPSHVHFVLATTEPYKLLDTIRSRTQRFDFHPIPTELLADHLAVIAASEGYEADRDALLAIARHATGSARDALSLLEQVAALADGAVSARDVGAALGVPDRDAYAELGRAIVDHDARLGLQLVARLASSGIDLRRFVSEGVEFYRGVFLAHYAPNLEEIADDSSDVLAEWRFVAKTMPPSDVLRAVERLSEALIRLREGREERLMVELAVLKLTRPEVADDVPSLMARVDRLDEQVRLLAVADPPVAPSPPAKERPRPEQPAPEAPADQSEAIEVPEEGEQSQPTPLSVPEPDLGPPPSDLTLERVEEVWPMLFSAVRDELGPRNQAFFREARPGEIVGSTVVLWLPAHMDFHLEQLQGSNSVLSVVSKHFSEMLGGAVDVRFEPGPDESESSDAPLRAPDKETMLEAPNGDLNPTELVQTVLGGELVEDSDAG